MGAYYHVGEYIGANAPIDDSTPDEHKVYSSAKVEQLFDGEKPYKVLVTAAANQTYGDQLKYIANHLPSNYDDIYRHCKLERGSSELIGFAKTAFIGHAASSNGFYLNRALIDASDPKYSSVWIKSDGSIVYSEKSEDTNSLALTLVIA